jgi:hypothetical protein
MVARDSAGEGQLTFATIAAETGVSATWDCGKFVLGLFLHEIFFLGSGAGSRILK